MPSCRSSYKVAAGPQSPSSLQVGNITSFYYRIHSHIFAFWFCQWKTLPPPRKGHVQDKPLGFSSGRIPLPLDRSVDIIQAPPCLSIGFWFLMASSDPPSPTFPPLPPPPGQLFSLSPKNRLRSQSLGQDESFSRTHKSAGLWPLTFLLTSHTGRH